MFDMRRREFITLLGGAAAAWPLAARAQQPGKLPTIGFLVTGTPSSHGQWFAALVQRLHELGWIEGRTVAIEYRWAEGRTERFNEIAAEFVRLKVDVILTHNTPTVLAAKQVTSVTPIVFATAGDPVGSGLVASLARPGGNVTGLSSQGPDAAGKQLKFMREVIPGLRRLAVLANLASAYPALELAAVQAAARTLNLDVAPFDIRRAEDIAVTFEALKGSVEALYVVSRPARYLQPKSHQHVGARRATADYAHCPGVRGSGRPADVLWTKLAEPIPARRQVRRQNSARGEACRPSGRAADQVRSGLQPDHCQGNRSHRATDAARAR